MMTYRPPLTGYESVPAVINAVDIVGRPAPAEFDPDWSAYSFPGGRESLLYLAFPTSHSTKASTQIHLLLTWAGSVASANPISITAEYRLTGPGQTATPVSEWESVTRLLVCDSANKIDESLVLTLNDCAICAGCCFAVRLRRNGITDTCPATFRLLHAEVCVQIDSFGSCGVGDK